VGSAAGIAAEMNEPEKPHWQTVTNLCLVTAVDIEFNTATSLLDQKTFSIGSNIKTCRGTYRGRAVTVLQCGMGARGFGGLLKHHLQDNHYQALLIAGLAGALKPEIKTGDAVIYDLCHDARQDFSFAGCKEKQSARDEKASIRCDTQLSESLFELLQLYGCRSFRGAGVTAARIVTSRNEKIRLGTAYKAEVVDMESFEVLSVCSDYKLPVAVLRVISDEADHDLPDFNSAAGKDGRINYLLMAWAMAAKPAGSLRFLLGIRPVTKALQTSLKAILNA